jgi:nitrogenase subunit NifH
MESEIYARTAIEHSPKSTIADMFRNLAASIYGNKEKVSPTPLSTKELADFALRIRQKTREEYIHGPRAKLKLN